MEAETQQWYASWFNTPYYHILYKDRGYDEAQEFMRNLTDFLSLSKDAKVLDLACGKGRHSIYLNSLGYDVTGVDLSKNSIAHAKQYENDTLQFEVHDMCKPMSSTFDAIFNLFTSFGYFEDDIDNLRTIQAIKKSLNAEGVGVIDFMNVHQVIKNIVPKEEKVLKGITFKIRRYVENEYIYKEIKFEDSGQQYAFTEKVKALTLNHFKNYFEKAGLTLLHCFGNYQLENFDIEKSPRLILIFG